MSTFQERQACFDSLIAKCDNKPFSDAVIDEIINLRTRCEKAEKDAAYRLDTLKEVRETLEVANVTPNGPINDTIWYSDCETLFDFMDAAIARERTS